MTSLCSNFIIVNSIWVIWLHWIFHRSFSYVIRNVIQVNQSGAYSLQSQSLSPSPSLILWDARAHRLLSCESTHFLYQQRIECPHLIYVHIHIQIYMNVFAMKFSKHCSNPHGWICFRRPYFTFQCCWILAHRSFSICLHDMDSSIRYSSYYLSLLQLMNNTRKNGYLHFVWVSVCICVCTKNMLSLNI